jgi:hypothetical protein
MANGDIEIVAYYEIDLPWDEGIRGTTVVVLEGNPLLGAEMLEGYLVQLEMTPGGEVMLEPL